MNIPPIGTALRKLYLARWKVALAPSNFAEPPSSYVTAMFPCVAIFTFHIIAGIALDTDPLNMTMSLENAYIPLKVFTVCS
jgi:hypothetical protein